ncbi:KTSC domain-containing protein [Edaphobacter modestus]|nr:KTSC domain-containing protein [Edaphobacter modestus]
MPSAPSGTNLLQAGRHRSHGGVVVAMPSSVIASMQYDAQKRTLTILYRGKRGAYRYYNVTPEEYDAFRTAPSKGAYLNETFKARQHPYERLNSSHFIHLVK